MPKGYISFSDFKTKQNVKTRVPKCPRCHKPMYDVMHNYWGKVMCADCFQIEQEKLAANRQRKEAATQKDEVAEDEYEEYERQLGRVYSTTAND